VYTISSPDVHDTFEITIEVDPEGTLTPWLADADPGTTVRVLGPFGNAYYEGESEVFVLAGGPGIGPAIAIAERVAGNGGRPTVIYRDEAPFHRDRFQELDKNGASVTILDPESHSRVR
jgi:3-phenylpropionate/trans-cinnamate dioxygenase ferredoxin reductase subunit